jgi:hypothetical protein
MDRAVETSTHGPPRCRKFGRPIGEIPELPLHEPVNAAGSTRKDGKDLALAGLMLIARGLSSPVIHHMPATMMPMGGGK